MEANLRTKFDTTKIDSLVILTDRAETDTTHSVTGEIISQINIYGNVGGEALKRISQRHEVKEGFQQKTCAIKKRMAIKTGMITKPEWRELITRYVNSKMIGSDYLKGITKETIVKAYEFDQSLPHTPKLSLESMMNSEPNDIDLTDDYIITEEEHIEGVKELKTILGIEQIEFSGKDGNIEIGNRDGKGYHLTIYRKDWEIEKKLKRQQQRAERNSDPNEIHSHYEEMFKVKTNITRVELNMKDAHAWEANGLTHPRNLKELLTWHEEGMLNDIPSKSINLLWNIKPRTKMNDKLTPIDLTIVELMKMAENGTGWDKKSIANKILWTMKGEDYDPAVVSRHKKKMTEIIETMKDLESQEKARKERLKNNPLLKGLGLI